MLDRYLEQHGDRFVSELRELCAIPSEATDPSALDAAARWCGERLTSAGAESHELRVEGAPALVVGETGAGKRTLICVQHYDVQPAVPLDLWRSPPYDPAVRDGAVFARGVDDNKGHLLLRIQAVEAYRALNGELPLRVRFLIEGEEESGSSNLARILALDATLTDGDGALKEGGAIDAAGRPQLLLGGKGIFYVELRVRSMARDAHSGAATHLPNAAWRLVTALDTLVDRGGRILIDGFYDDVRPPTEAERVHMASLPFESDVVKRMYEIDSFAWGRTDAEARIASVYEPTCNICGLVSGFTGDGTKTVIPSEAMVKIDFRLVPEQDPARIRTLLRAHLASLPFESDVVKRMYEIDSFAWGRSDAEARIASVYEPTCNICGLVSGFIGEGTKTVIPSEAMVKIDFRLVPTSGRGARLDGDRDRGIPVVRRSGDLLLRNVGRGPAAAREQENAQKQGR